MSSSLEKILDSKRELRRKLALKSVAEKLRSLEALRERQETIRRSSGRPQSAGRNPSRTGPRH